MDLSLESQLRTQAWLNLPTEATALRRVWLASSIVTRRCDCLFGACECLWRRWRDFTLERELRNCENLILTEAT